METRAWHSSGCGGAHGVRASARGVRGTRGASEHNRDIIEDGKSYERASGASARSRRTNASASGYKHFQPRKHSKRDCRNGFPPRYRADSPNRVVRGFVDRRELCFLPEAIYIIFSKVFKQLGLLRHYPAGRGCSELVHKRFSSEYDLLAGGVRRFEHKAVAGNPGGSVWMARHRAVQSAQDVEHNGGLDDEAFVGRA